MSRIVGHGKSSLMSTEPWADHTKQQYNANSAYELRGTLVPVLSGALVAINMAM